MRRWRDSNPDIIVKSMITFTLARLGSNQRCECHLGIPRLASASVWWIIVHCNVNIFSDFTIKQNYQAGHQPNLRADNRYLKRLFF